MSHPPLFDRRPRPFLPPYLLDRLSRSKDAAVRRAAVDTIAVSAALRAVRSTLATLPIMAAIPAADRGKERRIYNMKQRTYTLPGTLIIREGGKTGSLDAAAREAYGFLGATYDFFKGVLGRNSLDDNGMALIASVHYGRSYANAFWNGEQMVFGDGDGAIFLRFTRGLDIVAHELAHGVVAHTANFDYYGQPGAVNEHFADVFGVLAKQRKLGQTAAKADWLIGADIMGPKSGIRAIRTFKAGKAFENDPVFGTDPQPKHMKDIYKGRDDEGGVHINSGIPNHAFYAAAAELGGKAWETLGPVWYKALLGLRRRSDIAALARATLAAAGKPAGAAAKAVAKAWKAVGVDPRADS